MRWTMLCLPMVLVAAACKPTVQCPDGSVVPEGDPCPSEQPTDTEPGDTDTDVDPVQTDDKALLTLTWEVTQLPTDNVILVECDGRRLLNETNFTYFTEHVREFEVDPDVTCTVRIEDERGGVLSPGHLTNCSQEVASWEAQRSLGETVAEITTFACILGCVDPVAENYDANANLDDGSCEYIPGCNDPRALNFDPTATRNDGSCDFGGFGPLEMTVFTDDGPDDTIARVVCNGAVALEMGTGSAWNDWTTYTKKTVIDAGYDCDVVLIDTVGDRGPSGLITTCGEVALTWERPEAQSNEWEIVVGSFFSEACSGCTDPVASNYLPDAQIDDGSCVYPDPI